MKEQRLLVVAPNWIGDAIMAQPLLRRLREQPGVTHLAVMAPPHVAPVLAFMPEVDAVLSEPLAHGRLQWRDRVALGRRLRDTQPPFDAAFVLPNSFKSALVPWLAGIPRRAGLLGEARYVVLNERHPNPARGRQRPPIASMYASLAGELPREFDPRGCDRPRLKVGANAIAQARAQHLAGAAFVVGLCPGAEYGPAKRWPAEHFAALAERIMQRHPMARIVCLGGPKDEDVAQAIIAQARVPVHSLCGRTSLSDAIALIASLKAVVTNDSGLMHVAAALDIPLVALYGSTDPHHTPPHSPVARTARIDIACSPCFARECPLGHFKCMRELTPDTVMRSLAPMLEDDAHPTSTEADHG